MQEQEHVCNGRCHTPEQEEIMDIAATFIEEAKHVAEMLWNGLSGKKDHLPALYVEDIGGKGTVAILDVRATPCEIATTIVPRIIKQTNAVKTALIQGAWMMRSDDYTPGEPFLCPREHPRRREAVVIAAADVSGHAEGWMADLHRGPTRLGPWLSPSEDRDIAIPLYASLHNALAAVSGAAA